MRVYHYNTTHYAGAQALATAKARRKLKQGPAKHKTTTPYSVDDLLTRAEDAMDAFQLDLAVKFCDKARGLEPNCVRVLDTLGPLLLETGDSDRALDISSHCVCGVWVWVCVGASVWCVCGVGVGGGGSLC